MKIWPRHIEARGVAAFGYALAFALVLVETNPIGETLAIIFGFAHGAFWAWLDDI